MPSTPLPAPRPIPGWGTLGLYGLPTIGLAAPRFFVDFYFLSFATDALLIAPAVVGAILAGGRIWDAVSDPLAGYGSDRTRTRWGRRRPWMAAGAPASALAFLALWNPPASLGSPAALALWSAAALFLMTSAFTAWGIPHQALALDLSDDTHARTRLFGLRFAASLWGAALSFGGMQLVGNAADPRGTAGSLAWIVAAAMLVVLWVPALSLRERSADHAEAGAPPLRVIRDVVSDPDTRRLLAIWFIAQLGMSSQGVVAPYMSRYVLGHPELMGVMPALFIGPLVLSIPLWVTLARRHGRRRVWLASLIGASASYALLFLLPPEGFLWTGLLLGSAGFFTGCTGPIGPSLFASLVDAHAIRSGERREGSFFAAKEFVDKASGAAVVLIVGATLELTGFEPNAAQGEVVKLAIRACLGLFPAAGLLIAVALLRGLEVGRDPSPVRRRASRPRGSATRPRSIPGEP